MYCSAQFITLSCFSHLTSENLPINRVPLPYLPNMYHYLPHIVYTFWSRTSFILRVIVLDHNQWQIQWSNILLAIITIYVPWNSFWSFGSAPEGVRRTESIESQQWQSSPIPLQLVNNNLLTRKLHVRFYTMNYFFEICFPWLSLVVAFNNFQWPSSGPNEIPNRKLCKQHLNESTHEISRNLVDYIVANGQVWI